MALRGIHLEKHTTGDFLDLNVAGTRNVYEAARERRHAIRTIAYRLGMLVPESIVGYGYRQLKGGVDDRDVAQAFLLGLYNSDITFDAFNVMAEVPFSTEELARWSREPETFLEERYQGVAKLVEEQRVDFGELVRMWGVLY